MAVSFSVSAQKPSLEKTQQWITKFFQAKVYNVKSSSFTDQCTLQNHVRLSTIQDKDEIHAIDFKHIAASRIEIINADRLLITDGGQQSILVTEGRDPKFTSKPLSVMYSLNEAAMAPRIKKALNRLSELCDGSGLDDTF